VSQMIPKTFPQQFSTGVRCIATVANDGAQRIPICSVFSSPRKTGNQITRSRYFSESQEADRLKNGVLLEFITFLSY